MKNNKRMTIWIVIAIFFISVNLRPGITSIGPILDVIREKLQLSNAQVTLLTSIPVISMGLFASLSPILNRRIGVKNTIVMMLLVIGIMTGVRGIWPNYPVLLISALSIGIAIAVIGPLLSAIIKQNFPEHTATVIGVYSFGMGVGSAASAGLTAVFYEWSSSYAFALSIWAVLVVIALIVWIFGKRYPIQVAEKKSEDEANVEERSPWKEKQAWLFLLFFGLQSSAFFSIITWLAPIAISKGLSLLQASTLLTIMTTVQIFLNILLPIAMDRYFTRRFWLLLMLISGMGAIFCFGTGNYAIMIVGAFLMGLPLGGLFPIALLLPLDATRSATEANKWTAMMQTGGFTMGGIIPLFIGLIVDLTNNHFYTLLIMIILYSIMFTIAFILPAKKRI